MEVGLFNFLTEWGLTPQLAILATLLVWNVANQHKIIKELSNVLQAISDRVLILETKDEERTKAA